MWKQLWKLNIPPKVKHFISRSLHDILPTNEKLINKGMNVFPDCFICRSGMESVTHIFLGYRRAREIWGRCVPDFQVNPVSTLAFAESWWRMREMLSEEKLGVAMVVCWVLWNDRNKVVQHKKCWDTEVNSVWILNFIESYQSMNQRRSEQQTGVLFDEREPNPNLAIEEISVFTKAACP